jgi:hypothetical protein
MIPSYDHVRYICVAIVQFILSLVGPLTCYITWLQLLLLLNQVVTQHSRSFSVSCWKSGPRLWIGLYWAGRAINGRSGYFVESLLYTSGS